MWCAIAVLFFTTTDYITGTIKAIMKGDLSSQKMRTGLGHKLTYLIITVTAWFIDTASPSTYSSAPSAASASSNSPQSSKTLPPSTPNSKIHH